MRAAVVLLSVMLFLTMLVGCSKTPDVVGCWVTDDPDDYYFQLYDDNTCMMFNAAHEWVSSGTYEAYEDRISFETDTGDFVWARNDKTDTMRFEANGTRFEYYLRE